MAENSGKPNNELYELNELLAGVEPSEESVDDILAEVYGKRPEGTPAAPQAPSPGGEAGPETGADGAPEPDSAGPPPAPEEIPLPPVVRDDDADQPDVLADPEPPKRRRGKLVAFPGTQVPEADSE